jgi:hypothetical protein
MIYYTYTPSGTKATLVGMSRQEISSSVNPFLAAIGKKGIFTPTMTISEETHITMKRGNPSQFNQVSAVVREGFELLLGYEAFVTLVPVVQNEKYFAICMTGRRLGKLCCYTSSPFDAPNENSWLLPEYVLQGIQQYNWDQYTEWMGRLTLRLEKERELAQSRQSEKDKGLTFVFRDPKK